MSGAILQPGEVVAQRYRVERLIGSGGYARVYRAMEIGLERPVALKLLTPSTHQGLSTPESVRKRFYREARLISKVQDPRTVTIYEYDVLEDGQLYMALEYIDGVDLATLIRQNGALAPERITRLLTQILLGLRAAHAHGMLHRDVKPSNVMVYDRYGEPDCVKLLDFGIAKAVMAEAEQAMGQDLTLEGAVVGTPRYMSPEQLLGKPLTPATDLFSTGLLLYEMFVGRSPFDTHDRTEIYRRMETFSSSLGRLEEAPEPLERVARGLLSPSLDKRFQSAEEVLDVLLDSGRDAHPSGGGVHLRPAAGGAHSPGRTARGMGGHSAPRPKHSMPSSVPHTSATPITFPLGFDRAGATPSSELTGIDIAEQTTAVLDISEDKLSADRFGSAVRSGGKQGGDAAKPPLESRPEEDIISTQSLVQQALPESSRIKLLLALLAAIVLALAIWGGLELIGASESTNPEPAAPNPMGQEASAAMPESAAESAAAAASSVSEARERAEEQAKAAADEVRSDVVKNKDSSTASQPSDEVRKRSKRKRRVRPRRRTEPSRTDSQEKLQRSRQKGEQAAERDDAPDAPSFEIKPFE